MSGRASELSKLLLRSNPRFGLISFDQLDAAQRREFAFLRADPESYGILVPPSDSALPVKCVSRDAALLLQTLREPARVPHLLGSLFGSNIEENVRQLILDGVLEVQKQEGFVTGPSAFEDYPVIDGASTHVARLSRDAITYAAQLSDLSVAEIASRLYMFNRIPSTPGLQRQFADSEQVIAYLLRDSDTVRGVISDWRVEVSQDAWLLWRTSDESTALPFKLYVSPTIDAVPKAFSIMVDALAHTSCRCFKAGLTVFGLLRPDKLVAYFKSLEDLQEAAELISAAARGMPAHGVPFSGAIDAGGLVSWGMDPPAFVYPLVYQPPQSWRQWIAERVAIYIVMANESAAESTTHFVLGRLSMDGVKTDTWTPNLAIWRSHTGFSQEFA